MKRKHGLVNMDGTPRMGVPVSGVDSMPYAEWEKGPEARSDWRKQHGAMPWQPSDEERARNVADAEARANGRRRGTSAASGFDEEEARRLAKGIRTGLESAAQEAAERARDAEKLLNSLKSLSEGAIKRGKKIGKIALGCVPFLGVAGDVYGYTEDAESVGPGYARGNAAANNTPGVEQAKGVLDIISAMFTGEDMFHPNGLGPIVGKAAGDALRHFRHAVEQLPATLDTLEGARDAGIPVYPARGSMLDRLIDSIRGPFRNW